MDGPKVCIVGGGNLGHALAACVSAGGWREVRVLTRRPELWSNTIKANIAEKGSVIYGTPALVTDDPHIAVNGADVVIITVPSFATKEVVTNLIPYIRTGTMVGCFPGTGGFEWMARGLLKKGCVIFGLQRVPYICRTVEYGHEVTISSVKSELFVAALPRQKIGEVCSVIESLVGIPVIELSNYLEVTLTPSNPILHTSRLYALFRDWRRGHEYPRQFLFYEEWDDISSEVLLACDDELQKLCKAIPLDLKGVKSLRLYYESPTASEMTRKISSIKAFKGITAPMIWTGTGYVPDLESRYFVEDFPFGLIILKGLATLAECETPMIDELLLWYQCIAGRQYVVSGSLRGRDVDTTGAPQAFGFKTLSELVEYYV